MNSPAIFIVYINKIATLIRTNERMQNLDDEAGQDFSGTYGMNIYKLLNF